MNDEICLSRINFHKCVYKQICTQSKICDSRHSKMRTPLYKGHSSRSQNILSLLPQYIWTSKDHNLLTKDKKRLSLSNASRARNSCLPSAIFLAKHHMADQNWVGSAIWLTRQLRADLCYWLLQSNANIFCQPPGSVLNIPLYYVCTHVHTYVSDGQKWLTNLQNVLPILHWVSHLSYQRSNAISSTVLGISNARQFDKYPSTNIS